MAGLVTGQRPDISPAQIISGIPILANLLNVFGLYTLTPDQVSALEQAGIWAIALIFGDAAIRFGRNLGTTVGSSEITDEEILDFDEEEAS